MTDDNDRTQEIRRDGDQYRPAGQGDSSPAQSDQRSSRRDDTAEFSRPPQNAPGQAPGYRPAPAPQQQGGAYPPAGGGYRPAQPAPAQAYGAPMLPIDRGSGGFPAAIIGAVVATLLAVATSFGAYQILKNHSSIDARKLPGFVTYRMGLLPWPSGRGGDLTTAFIVGVLVVLVVTVLLMMAAAMSTRAGTGGFALFLAAWMASVIAGGGACVTAGLVARQQGSWSYAGAAWQNDLGIGLQWGLLFGWITALVLVIVHAMRRKPAQR